MKYFWEMSSREVSAMVEKGMVLLRSRFGLWFLGIISFADSALGLPIVTDPFLVAYIMSNRSRALVGTLVTILASVLGGVMMYLLSAFFIDQLLALFSSNAIENFHNMVSSLDEGTFALAFLGALTPIPYTFVAIAAGALKGSLLMFVLGSLLGRILRFGIVGYLTYYFGERAMTMAKKNTTRTAFVALVLFGLYILYKVWL